MPELREEPGFLITQAICEGVTRPTLQFSDGYDLWYRSTVVQFIRYSKKAAKRLPDAFGAMIAEMQSDPGAATQQTNMRQLRAVCRLI
jgi:hypothetical protein